MIIKDLNTKQTLLSFNETKKVSPASLTKILTAIVAIETKRMDEKFTITKEMINVEPTKINLKVGDTIFVKDLVHAILISSSNDAAKSLSIYLGNGKEQNFIDKMNEKTKKIGMKNSHFTNASGFDIGNHHSTSEDLMKLAEYAVKNKLFNEIVKKKEYTFYSTNTNTKYVSKTHNKLLNSEEHAIGIKTGYTKKAGPCLIARIKKDKKDILIIVLNAKINRFDAAKNIFALI